MSEDIALEDVVGTRTYIGYNTISYDDRDGVGYNTIYNGSAMLRDKITNDVQSANFSNGVLLTNGYTSITSAANPYAPDKLQCWNVYCTEGYKFIRGRLFGIKILQSKIGNMLDTVNIPCDEQYLYTKGGTPTEHWLLFARASNTGDYTHRLVIPK